MSVLLNGSTVLLAALVGSAPAMFAQVRITDADERFRIKYGRFPPHIERARKAETEATAERNRSAEARMKRSPNATINKEKTNEPTSDRRSCDCTGDVDSS